MGHLAVGQSGTGAVMQWDSNGTAWRRDREVVVFTGTRRDSPATQ